MSNHLESLKKAYPLFKSKLTLQEFIPRVNSLETEIKWNFVRASLLYQQALKCKNCEPNVAMALLCSCADAMKIAGGDAGSRENFKKFYLDYCSTDLRGPPIEYYPNGRLPSQIAPFEKALDFIYSKFRCLYVHEGIGRLENLPSGVKWISATILDVYNGECYNVDTVKILEWFAKITAESLYQFLLKHPHS